MARSFNVAVSNLPFRSRHDFESLVVMHNLTLDLL